VEHRGNAACICYSTTTAASIKAFRSLDLLSLSESNFRHPLLFLSPNQSFLDHHSFLHTPLNITQSYSSVRLSISTTVLYLSKDGFFFIKSLLLLQPFFEHSTYSGTVFQSVTRYPTLKNRFDILKFNMLSKLAVTFSLASAAMAAGVSVTPHEQYSSSIGVLGCMVDTNRIAYFPMWPDCNNLCKKVTANGRSVHLLHIDASGGAFDMSYDAWNYLNVGASAKEQPTVGGGIPAEVEDAPMSECVSLIKTPDGKLPLMAANSVNTFVGCPEGSWIHENSALYNIQTSGCLYGYNEVCQLDLAVSNQPSCPHQLGAMNPLSGLPVMNIQYSTGTEVISPI